MKCEICGEQTATMWVEAPCKHGETEPHPDETLSVDVVGWCHGPKKVLSCDDCGPQLGYKILAPLTTNIRSRD